MPGHDFQLPVCQHPTNKPFHGFTTLLHRFDRYERERFNAAAAHFPTLDAASPAHNISQPDSTIPKREMEIKKRAQPNGESLRRRLTLDTLGRKLMRAAATELTNQQVVLTERQQVNLALAKIKTDVDSLSREYPADTAAGQHVSGALPSPNASAAHDLEDGPTFFWKQSKPWIARATQTVSSFSVKRR
ncbi:hypothetical protein HDU89_001023 [Geranomyces variabilis]|nr:hypothetical protein HDU89_001023 [Geranomyces variabilis]